MMTKIRLQRLAKRLIGIRPKDFSWGWLRRPDQSTIRKLSKKRANKFMLNCIIDYQMDTDQVWEHARRLSEDVLGDRIFGEFSGWVGAEGEEAFRVKAVGSA